MKWNLCIFVLLCSFLNTWAQKQLPPPTAQLAGALVPIEIDGSDTIYLFQLPNVYAFPKLHLTKRQEKYYWTLVRDVKKTLPYSKLISKVLRETNDTLMRIPTEKERDKYMKKFENEIYKKYEKDFKKMTFNQGKLLIRLIDRECEYTSYDLIKVYRGSFTAGFYQLFAKSISIVFN